MSRTEVIRFANKLSQRDRRWLRDYLEHLERVNDRSRQKRLGDAMRRMDAGRKVDWDESSHLLRAGTSA